MPYRIKKAKGKDGYYVYGAYGKRHSKEPMELEMAKKQITALNIAHAKKDVPVKKARKTKSKAVEVIAVPTKIEKKEVIVRSPVAKAKRVAKAVDAANKEMRPPPMATEMTPGLANTALLNFRRKTE